MSFRSEAGDSHAAVENLSGPAPFVSFSKVSSGGSQIRWAIKGDRVDCPLIIVPFLSQTFVGVDELTALPQSHLRQGHHNTIVASDPFSQDLP